MNNMAFLSTVEKTAIGAVFHDSISFTFLHNMFRLMLINDQNTNKRGAEISLYLTKIQRENVKCAAEDDPLVRLSCCACPISPQTS
jgi:hypothetical protein